MDDGDWDDVWSSPNLQLPHLCTGNQVQAGDRDRGEVWSSPNLQLPAYQWADDEVVPDLQATNQGGEEEVTFEHTSTEDWEQEIAIDVIAVEGDSTPDKENNTIPDGRTDVEMGMHPGRRQLSEAKNGREVSRPWFSINTCRTFFSIFSFWTFLLLVLWTLT